jgi:hypothetical protein
LNSEQNHEEKRRAVWKLTLLPESYDRIRRARDVILESGGIETFGGRLTLEELESILGQESISLLAIARLRFLVGDSCESKSEHSCRSWGLPFEDGTFALSDTFSIAGTSVARELFERKFPKVVSPWERTSREGGQTECEWLLEQHTKLHSFKSRQKSVEDSELDLKPSH